jgi:hypothetical protein
MDGNTKVNLKTPNDWLNGAAHAMQGRWTDSAQQWFCLTSQEQKNAR